MGTIIIIAAKEFVHGRERSRPRSPQWSPNIQKEFYRPNPTIETVWIMLLLL